MASLSSLQTTPTPVSGEGSTLTTHHASNQGRDYDWVLPVVVVLSVLIVLLFVSMIFLIYQRYRDSTYKRTRQCVCDCRNQPQEIYQLRPYNGHRRHTIETSYIDIPNSTPEPRIESAHDSLSDTDPEMNTRTRDASTSFGHDVSALNTHPNNGDASSLFPECVHEARATSVSLLPLVGTEPTIVHDIERNHSTSYRKDHEQSYISQSRARYLRNESTQSELSGNVLFYLGEAFSDSDLDSGPSRNEAAYAVASRKGHRLEKSVTVTGLRNQSDQDTKRGYFDRQVSNQSVPAYSHDVSFSPEFSQPIGKFETVYDLASSRNYEETVNDSPRNFAVEVTRKYDNMLPEVEQNDMSLDTDTAIQMCNQGESTSGLINNKLAYQIPTIILPKGGHIDYDSENDKMSFYNSSSMESGMSSPPRTHRRARANNPFCIEADRPPYVGDMIRPSSAPPIPYSRRQSLDQRNLLGEMTRSASVYCFTLGGSSGHLFPDLRRDSSRSWSEELYDVIRESGVTDAEKQRRMKELIDARYSYIFDRKYPELNSIYPSLQNNGQYGRRLTPKKKKLKSKKRRKPLSKNDSSGSDQYDRLQLPEMIYSERRPARFIREGPYGEDFKTKPDNIPYPTSRISLGISLGQSSVSDNYASPLHNPRDSAFLSLQGSRESARSKGSNSSNVDPLYESIPSLQSSFCHSSPNSSIDLGHSRDKVIYDRIGESKDRNKPDDVAKTDSEAPMPPSTTPPVNPNLLRYISNSYKSGSCTVASLSSGNSITVENVPEAAPDVAPSDTFLTHTSETATESSSDNTTDTTINLHDNTNEGIPKDFYAKDGESPSVTFFASSGDTPLEHSSSRYHDSCNGGPYLEGSLGAAQDGSMCGKRTSLVEDDDSLFTAIPYQRKTLSTDYDGSIQISRV